MTCKQIVEHNQADIGMRNNVQQLCIKYQKIYFCNTLSLICGQIAVKNPNDTNYTIFIIIIRIIIIKL